MTLITHQLDAVLRQLDPDRAKNLEKLVREALALATQHVSSNSTVSNWPAGYFDSTAGAFAGEPFERPPQGDLSDRDPW